MNEDWKENNSRKARIGENRCAEFDNDKPWAVFMHTHYLSKWYYNGYTAHKTKEEAEAAREEWLSKAT